MQCAVLAPNQALPSKKRRVSGLDGAPRFKAFELVVFHDGDAPGQ